MAIVTSTKKLGNSNIPTGYELTELARAYWIFQQNGYTVDIASPNGGSANAVIDDEDMGIYDYAFLNDAAIQQQLEHTLKVEDIDTRDYAAVYFVGGKGAMFDFPNNPHIQNLVLDFFYSNKPIAAICHGPAAFTNLKTSSDKWFVEGKKLTSFTNSEELFLKPDAESIFPFLLQSRLVEQGAQFTAAPDYLANVSVYPNLITGQNPWSAWQLAEMMIRQLGHTPLYREPTHEENSIELIQYFHQSGLGATEKYIEKNNRRYLANLVLMHSVVALMKGNLLDGFALIMITDSVRTNNNNKVITASKALSYRKTQ